MLRKRQSHSQSYKTFICFLFPPLLCVLELISTVYLKATWLINGPLRLAEDTDEQTLYPSLTVFMKSFPIFDTVETTCLWCALKLSLLQIGYSFEKRRQIGNCLNLPDKTMNHWNLSAIIECCAGMFHAGVKWKSWSHPLQIFCRCRIAIIKSVWVLPLECLMVWWNNSIALNVRKIFMWIQMRFMVDLEFELWHLTRLQNVICWPLENCLWN